MTVVAQAPVSPAGSTLAPYTAANRDIVQPGRYGVSHGSGIIGELISHATESWAGHAFVYVGFALEVLKIRTGQELDPVFTDDHWRVCSALVADCYAYAGLNLEQGLPYPNLISPADLYNLIAHQA